MPDSICTDTDAATDPDGETFILIGPSVALYAVPYGLTGGRAPHLRHLHFPAILSRRYKAHVCDPAMS